MESIKNSSKSLSSSSWNNNLTNLFQKALIITVTILIFLTLIILFLILTNLFSVSSSPHSRTVPSPLIPVSSSTFPLHSKFIKNTCTNTLYPSLCFHTIKNATNNNLLQFSIRKTIQKVTTTRSHILAHFNSKHLINSQEKVALENCMDMLDQTLYELKEAIKQLHSNYAYHHIHIPPPYISNYLKTLLSAAMTNQNTCIDGFSESDGHKEYFHKSLTPILHMISNSLAIINYIETTTHPIETLKNPRLLINNMYSHGDNHILSWMSSGDRKMMETESRDMAVPSVSVIVAVDGSGNFTKISDAVRMAPNESSTRYVIQIKAGIYNENVVIPRHKVNIMLIGDGMNSTVITGSKNRVDGFSTFNSATLIVVGNKFLARDLTIVNTSGPEKHQAVAMRVTSNAAFYRCQFISYQDTLYAHSLGQLYRECAIQGSIDFIFGNAAAIFQKCLILVRKPNAGQKNVITAQGRLDPNQNTGISLQDCTIMAAPDFSINERRNFSTFLGRPWRNYSRTVVMKSYLGDLIDPQGWCRWNEYSNLDTVEYIEFMNFGPGADTRKRVKWGGYQNNSSRDVDKFTVEAFLHGADDWLKSTDFPLFSGLHARDSQKQALPRFSD